MLHAFVVVFLGFALAGIMLLVVVGWLPALLHRLVPDLAFEGGVKSGVLVLAGLLVITPLVLLAIAARRGALGWRNLALLAVPMLAVPVWLVHDDATIKHPLPLAEFAPEFPGAAQSYATLMRYSKRRPSAEAREFAGRQWVVTTAGWASLREMDKKQEFVAKQRAALEADWAALAPQRRWIDELNAFGRIGDLTPPCVDADIITFAVWRVFAQQSCAIALLQAGDGRGDDAIATLLPVLGCGRRLQHGSRTLVRSMVGVVIEKAALETAGVVLDRAPVSPARRRELAVVVSQDDPPAEVRHLVLIEYAMFAPAILRAAQDGDVGFGLEERWSWAGRPLKLLGSLLLNPNATINLIGGNAFQVAAFAEAREIGRIEAQTRQLAETFWTQPGMKNLGGRLVAVTSTPAYARVVESYWKMADLRADLRRRLAPQVVAN